MPYEQRKGAIYRLDRPIAQDRALNECSEMESDESAAEKTSNDRSINEDYSLAIRSRASFRDGELDKGGGGGRRSV